jgi:hypothetical protein
MSPRPRATRKVPPDGVAQSEVVSSQSRNARGSHATVTVRSSPGTTSSADGIADESHGRRSFRTPIDLNDLARGAVSGVSEDHRQCFTVIAVHMFSGSIVPGTPAESRAEPECRLANGPVPAAIANAGALGIVQRPVLRSDGPGRAIAVGYRESRDQAAAGSALPSNTSATA